MSNPDQFQLVRDPPPIGANPMLEEAYEPCQPNGRYDTAHLDDYHDWLAEIHARRNIYATDGWLSMAIARRVNPLTGQPLGLVWDTFYADVVA